MELLASEVLKISHTLRAIVNVLGDPPEWYGKTLLLNKPHIWVKEYWEMKMKLTWKSYPRWLGFRVLQGAMYFPKDKTKH